MNLIDIARDTLKGIPMADILRERLLLALDQYADAERKIADLQTEKGSLQGQLERERLDHQNTQAQLQQLKEKTAEDVRLLQDVEFRRGTRTGGRWMPFCPRCHLPIVFSRTGGEHPYCTDPNCGWNSHLPSQDFSGYEKSLSA